MSKVTITEDYLSDIADAIREKLDSTSVYTPGQMASAIESIPTGVTPTGTINITQNGQTDVTQYATADVNVPNSYAAGDEGKVVQSGALVAQTSETVTQNGTYDTTTKDEVVVNVSSGGISGVYKSPGAPASNLGSDGDIYIRTYPIPSGVTFVEYLEGDGTAYIDTGYTADEETGAYAKFEVTGGHPAFCARNTATARTFGIMCVDSGATLSLDMATTRSQTAVSLGDVVEARLNRFMAEKDGVVYNTTNPNSFTTPRTITLFAINASNSYGLVVFPSKIYRVTFLQDGVVVKDYIPALDGNGVPCMYESIGGTYAYNTAASGAFTYGSTATPPEAEPTIYRKENGVWTIKRQIGAIA